MDASTQEQTTIVIFGTVENGQQRHGRIALYSEVVLLCFHSREGLCHTLENQTTASVEGHGHVKRLRMTTNSGKGPMSPESSLPVPQDGCITRISALAVGYLVWLFGYFSIVLLLVRLPVGFILMGTYLAAYGAACYLVLKGSLTARIIKALFVVLPGLLIFGVLDWQTSGELSRGLAWLSKFPAHATGTLFGVVIGERSGTK